LKSLFCTNFCTFPSIFSEELRTKGRTEQVKTPNELHDRQFSEQEEIVVETLARSLCLLKYEGTNAKSIGQVLRKDAA